MRASLVIPLGLAALVMGGCATATATAPGGRDCHPIFSWAAPAYRCGGAGTAESATAAPEPVAETETGPLAEPEPEEKQRPEIEPEPEVAPRARVAVKARRIEVSERVEFRNGSAVLLPESEQILSEVADALKEHPEILRVRVEGHAEAGARSRHSQKLSGARARAVRKYLIAQGIKPSRLVAKAGRSKNRPVEFKILKRRRK